MKCKKCGFDNVENASYCINCGNRLDGRVQCPYCGEYIEKDAEICPKCNKNLKKDIEAIAPNPVVNSKKNRVGDIFRTVFAFLALGLFVLTLSIVSKEVLPGGGLLDSYMAREFFYAQWVRIFDAPELDIKAIICASITSFALAVNTFVLIFFSIKGIVNVFQFVTHKNKRIDRVYRSIMIMLLSVLVFNSVIYSFSSYRTVTSNVTVDVLNGFSNSLITIFIVLSVIFFIFVFIIESIFSNNDPKVKVSAKVLTGISFFFLMFMILTYLMPEFNLKIYDTVYGLDLKDHFFDALDKIIKGTSYNLEIADFAIASLIISTEIIKLSVMCFIIVFVGKSFFKNTINLKSFRIIYFVASLLFFIIVICECILCIVDMVLLNHFISGEILYDCVNYLTGLFGASITYMGFPIAVLIMLRRFNKAVKFSEARKING